MIEYPGQYLPLPQISGYALQTQSPLMRTGLKSGRARQRRMFTNVPTMATVTWRMTHIQAAYFEAWFSRTLLDGAQWFSTDLQTPGTAGDVASYECRFAGMYSGPTLLQGFLWEITATLELRERPLIPLYWDQFPDLWFGMNIIDMALNREWPEV